MTDPKKLSEAIFSIRSQGESEQIALELFAWHHSSNKVYRAFCDAVKRSPENVQRINQIPFLPVNLFRYQTILADGYEPVLHFETSGTTAEDTGKHYIVNPDLYLQSAINSFRLFYGDLQDYVVLALLPGYLERPHSSLVYMVKHWIQSSCHAESDFYLNDHERLFKALDALRKKKQKTILIGVTHALVDFSEKHQIRFPELIVMETGGMKGRRKEIARSELHSILKKSFGVPAIHSEYGMTELLSQAYSKAGGIFHCPPWMRVLLRDINDPMGIPENKKSGAINIIDLANIYSCPFLATDDTGILHSDGSFEVTGRIDFSAIRGCSTMIG